MMYTNKHRRQLLYFNTGSKQNTDNNVMNII